MRVMRVLLAVSLLSAVTLLAQSTEKTKASEGFSIENIDKSADPCVDFYQYACGDWMKTAEIPPDQPDWVSFVALHERNQTIERNILEKAAAGGANRNPIDQKIGDYDGACIDENAADAKGIEPLKPELNRIAAVTNKEALMDAIARVHLIGPNPLFNFYSAPDLHDANMVIAYIDQGGLTLPDRNYYVKDDAKMVEMRKRLVEYATQLFTLAGQKPDQASASAAAVLKIEIALAKASMDRTLRRDPKNRDHKMATKDAIALAPNFYLAQYFHNR